MYRRHMNHHSARMTIILVFTAITALISALMPLYYANVLLAAV